MRTFIYTLAILSSVYATELHTVIKHKISLDKNTTANLILQVGKLEYLAKVPAKIMINYEINHVKKHFVFTDTSKKYPIYYFDDMPMNTKKDTLLNLTNHINIFDIDKDGKNEIFIYGRSYYGTNGYVGSILMFKQNQEGTIQYIGKIETTDLSEIYYHNKKNIIIVAQSIWGNKSQEYTKNKHRYNIDIYELSNTLNKIPLYTTQKVYNDQNHSVVKDILNEIIKKYTTLKRI